MLKKRKLQEDVQRSGGVYGATELKEMADDQDEDKEEDLVQLVSGYSGNASESASQAASAMTDSSIKALVVVPSQEEISAEVTERKRLALLNKYAWTENTSNYCKRC